MFWTKLLILFLHNLEDKKLLKKKIIGIVFLGSSTHKVYLSIVCQPLQTCRHDM